MNKKTAKANYVDNQKLYEEIVIYKNKCAIALENNKTKPQIPNYAGYAIMAIARNMITMKNNRGEHAFLNYTFTEEMISDAIENCILYFDNFNPDKYKKPFAYFSKIIYYAFLRRITKEKKELYLKYKSALNHGIFEAINSPDSDSKSGGFEMFDNLIEFVETYEKKQKEKTLKAKADKLAKEKV